MSSIYPLIYPGVLGLFIDQFNRFLKASERTPLIKYEASIKRMLEQKLAEPIHGDLAHWVQTIGQTQHLRPAHINLHTDTIEVGYPEDLKRLTHDDWIIGLKRLHPWRKGPFNLFGTVIDTEWRSDWKWQRLQQHIRPLRQRTVLDIGCGSGYHLWRMAAQGPELAVGLEPMWLYISQFYLVKQWIDRIQPLPVFTLPLTLEEFPVTRDSFDTIFSMGVLYHRRDPLQHLLQIKSMLRSGGEMVLETMIVDGDANTCLIPEDRYCRMRNVWFLPSALMLERWCARLGFKNIRIVDISPTTTDEQRKTEWMWYDSLEEALHPAFPGLTIEELPGPKRVILIADH